MSIAGGLSLAFERGDALRCEAIQIFTQSNRQWNFPPLQEEDISAFKAAAKKAKFVKRVIAHNSYLLNLSTSEMGIRRKSVQFFIKVMQRCEALGVESLVTHPGSAMGASTETALESTAKSLNEVLKACSGFQTKILLENTAGQGGCVGYRFEHLRAIREATSAPEKVYFCFDTQHAFAAGYDLRTAESYEQTMADFDHQLGLPQIQAFHLNDALKEFGCRVDRHQNIGKGFLGKEAFRPLLEDKRFRNVPMVLETDPGEDLKNYRRDLKILRDLIASSSRAPSTRSRKSEAHTENFAK